MSEKSIMCFDPGATTGWVQWICSPDYKQYEVAAFGQVAWMQRFEMVQDLVGIQSDGIVVIEDFKLYPNKRTALAYDNFPSVQVIGAVEYQVYLNGCWPNGIIKQSASLIRNVQILPQHERAFKGLEHASDAYKHGRYYILRRNHENH